QAFEKKDAKNIVIDETSGMMLSLLFLPYQSKILILGFFIFRLLDTLKPYPAGRIQNIKGSIGVMGDDIVAAVYTNIILQAVTRLVSFIAS
ncbi:MAG: phosphatidylglycerophosphatase A, partial [Candidatus Omnitrophica bacterium]|nr:phosphatidylglycerophosphatase A [Candidatus Omnitrophota bacterium]